MDLEARPDYSATQYACLLEDLERRLNASGQLITATPVGHTQENTPEERESLVEHAWTLVQAYLSHESLWLYLRGALRLSFSHDGLRLDSDTCGRVRDEARTLAQWFLSDGSADHGGSVLHEEHALEGKLKMHGGVVREIVAGASGELLRSMPANSMAVVAGIGICWGISEQR
ncbi:hypothetical protein TRAPUB_7597 [Trametes pubescens]|uniref:Uncharacterized protein n=1 Tax=Trametes pubescens TaxID=154538 RepID=A0A1M2V2Z4_TRAPU|nr:hypothetical protein TRAPUB_7597 [Trametes pubescens]